MTTTEWIVVIGFMLILFFVSGFVRNKLNPKTRLIVSIVSFTIFVWWIIIFYGNVKKYKRLQKNN